MDYKELMEKSRDVMGTKLCKSCLVCDGKAWGMLRCVTMMLGKTFV